MADRSDYLPLDRLKELAAQIEPSLQIEPQAEQLLQDVADDFVENVAAFACELVQHREGTTLETRDVQLALEKIWDMRLPGVGDSTTELKQIRKAAAGTTEAHRHRMQAVR